MFPKVTYRKNKDGSKREYLQIVESVRIKGKTHPQHKTIATLGRIDHIKEGQYDALIAALAKYSEKMKVLDLQKDIHLNATIKLGPRLVAEHIWNKLGLPTILSSLNFSESVQESLFQMVLARLDDPLSKRGTVKHLHWYQKPDETAWSLSTFYRTLDRIQPSIQTIEDRLFESSFGKHEQDDFFDPIGLDLVYFDTTSVSLHTHVDGVLERGYSKDHRPDLPQFLIGLVMTSSGRPLCYYFYPGNTADVVAFERSFRDIRTRFPIKRIILVADRGCISRRILDMIKDMGMEYILGARMRKEKQVRDEVLSKRGRFRRYDENLGFKEVELSGERFVVVMNKAQAYRDKQKRCLILEQLRTKLGQSLKTLSHNRGYKKYLKPSGRIEIDAAAVRADARYDGKWVLRSNVQDFASVDLLECYKALSEVESWFDVLKNELSVAPVYHWLVNRIESHVFVCFLAMLVWHYFSDHIRRHDGFVVVRDVWRSLEELKGSEVTLSGKRYMLRTDLPKLCQFAFRSLGMAFPHRIVEL